jgi:hypothetical protein
MGAARQARACSRCGEIKPPEDYVHRGRTCAACRAAGPPSAHRNLPRYCLRCHELKPPEAFAWGDGRKTTRKGQRPAFRRRRGVCQACIDQELREREEREQRAADRRSTWTVRGRRVRRCSKCGEVKDLENGFYVIRRNPRIEYGYRCRTCTIKASVASKQRRLADPATRDTEREKRRRWQREWRPHNPEAYHAAQRRWAERMKADPERYARHLEACRLAWRLKRERDGADLSNIRALRVRRMPRDRTPGRLPVAPLVEVIDRAIRQAGLDRDYQVGSTEEFLRELGLEPRSVRRWRTGEFETVQFDIADIALTRLGLTWWDVWPADRYPQVALQLNDELTAEADSRLPEAM